MESITSNKLIETVAATLESYFPAVTVQMEEPGQEAVKPSFGVGISSVQSTQELGNRYNRTYKVNIRYSPDGVTPNQSAHDTAEQLLELFRTVQLGGATYAVKETAYEVSEGVLAFIFTLALLVWHQDENE